MFFDSVFLGCSSGQRRRLLTRGQLDIPLGQGGVPLHCDRRVLVRIRLLVLGRRGAQREQAADAQGKLFEFEAQEDRDNADISYNISKETGAAQREDASRQRRDAATAGIFTGIGNVASGVASSAFTMGMGK